MSEDRIEVRGLRVFAVHGVDEAEQQAAQPFEIDLDISIETAAAESSDELGDTADYSRAIELATEVMAGPPRRLLETLAAEIAAQVLTDPHVLSVTVGLRKLRPPVPHEVNSAGVRVTRTR